jgi:hypothetical protein
LTWSVASQDAGTIASVEEPDFKVVIGDWIRPDGGYIVRFRDINPDDLVDTGYFNLRKINISESDVSALSSQLLALPVCPF